MCHQNGRSSPTPFRKTYPPFDLTSSVLKKKKRTESCTQQSRFFCICSSWKQDNLEFWVFSSRFILMKIGVRVDEMWLHPPPSCQHFLPALRPLCVECYHSKTIRSPSLVRLETWFILHPHHLSQTVTCASSFPKYGWWVSTPRVLLEFGFFLFLS